MEAEVAVVGAGPTGLALACELARHGVRVRVLERRAARSTRSKALAVHARTLEVWADVGVLAEALRRGRKIHGMNLYAGEKRLAHLSLDELESPYPFVLVLPQSETEAILEARAEVLGVRVERETELVGLTHDASGVELSLRRGGHDELARFDYAVGCGGAHSAVRKALGLAYTGSDVEARFVFADATLECDLATDEGHTWLAPEGVVLLVPLPEERQWRVIAGVPQDSERVEAPTLERIDALLRERVSFDYTLSNPVWLTGFDVRQRKVEDYRVGRVFLAGDSAHCHSPIGGQGMNTGQQDAYNLGWRLALVAKGLGREALLEAYTPEREPIARALLRGTERGTRVVTLRNPIGQAVRNQLASFLSGLDVVRQRLAREVGELSVYDLLQGTAHVLLLFDGAAATPAGYAALAELAGVAGARCGDAVRVFAVLPHVTAPTELDGVDVVLDSEGSLHAAFRAGAECLYLIRPDGYLGYRAQPPTGEQLLAYLDQIFTPEAQAT